jgi:membrane protease YdiL (CAAX protease family)
LSRNDQQAMSRPSPSRISHRFTDRMAGLSDVGSRNLLSNLILIFPLLIAYQLGVLVTYPMLNGVDFVSAFLFGTLGFTQLQYLIFVVAVVVAFLIALFALKRHQRFHPRVVVPILLESTIYALSMGTLIFLVMTKVLGIAPALAAALERQGVVSRFVMSLGAGVYEEIVFRLGLLGGLAALFGKVFGWRRVLAVPAAFVLSALAFSAVHHIGPLGDPVSLDVFTFRVLAGIFFGLLFWFRGLAVAVYTHAFYDLYVLLFR